MLYHDVYRDHIVDDVHSLSSSADDFQKNVRNICQQSDGIVGMLAVPSVI